MQIGAIWPKITYLKSANMLLSIIIVDTMHPYREWYVISGQSYLQCAYLVSMPFFLILSVFYYTKEKNNIFLLVYQNSFQPPSEMQSR